MLKSETYQVEKRDINGVPVSVTTYKIGDRYHCRINNIDPGGTIARGEGTSADEAQKQALGKARERLAGNFSV